MRRTATSTLLILITGISWANAQSLPTRDGLQAQSQADKPATAEKLSDAERISRLRRTIEESEKRLRELQGRLDDPQSEYVRSEQGFTQLDKELSEKKKQVQKATDENRPDQAAALQNEIEDLQKRWQLAKDRFDLAIQERKSIQEQKATLEQKIPQDKDALNKLIAPPATQPAQPTTTPAQPAPDASSPTGATPTQPSQTGDAANGQPAAQTQQPTAPPAAQPPTEQAPAQPGAAAATPAKPVSEQVQKAQEKLAEKEADAAAAMETVKSIEDRIVGLQKLIAGEKEQMKIDRQKADNSLETERTLTEQLDKRVSEGAPADEVTGLRTKITEARQGFRTARKQVNERVDRIDQLQDELQQLQTERIQALEEAEATLAQAQAAKKQVQTLENPLSWTNIQQWALQHAPRLAGIVLVTIVLMWLVRMVDKRLVMFLAGRPGPGSLEEREARADTLMSVFHNSASIIIVIGGIMMVIQEFGVAVVPLVGAAGVVGLAVAFGAQNLVRDYFTGFIILLENQYSINDVVKIAGVAGMVERITLRVTVLRDLEGAVHFVPNGQITTVSNLTHNWSRALFEIGISYNSDVDLAMKTLVELGKQLRADSTFRQLILEDPEMLGVDSLGDSAVMIKFFIKTRPLQQWTVKRAMLRRIKKRFDELGIEIPFPHRTIYHRYEHGQPATAKISATMEEAAAGIAVAKKPAK